MRTSNNESVELEVEVDGNVTRLTVPRWLAEKNGLV